MAYTFAVDTEKMAALENKLVEAKENISGADDPTGGIPGIFAVIKNLPADKAWSGSSYDAFYSGAQRYEEPMNTLPQVIEAFEKEVHRLTPVAEETISTISTEVTNMSSD